MADGASGAGAPGRRLTTRQVAELLGVKTQTVYAYASRGLLTSEPAPDGRGSTFDAREAEALAARRGRARPLVEADSDVPPMRSGITLSEGGRFYYRGRDAVALSEQYGFETAVGWLWGVGGPGGLPGRVELRAPDGLIAVVRRNGATLPAQVRLNDRLRVAVAVAASADPLRFDLSTDNVLAIGAALIAALVESLPPASDTHPREPEGDTLAARLWGRLAPAPATPDGLACLDQALVLLADHGLAASTLAARVAASARANPYAVVLAGLGPLDGSLHGAASGLAYRMLREVMAGASAGAVIAEHLRSGLAIPGIGMRAYPEGDPRGRAMLARLRTLEGAADVLGAVEAVVAAAAGRGDAHPNVDLGLAALSLATGMHAEAGEVIFAVSRVAGWIAHALEEYAEPALRLRPRGVYTGPRPVG